MSVYRVSVDETPLAITSRLKVWLNDVQIEKCCVAADPVEGWVDVYDELYRGVPLQDLTIKRLYGAVRLEAVE